MKKVNENPITILLKRLKTHEHQPYTLITIIGVACIASVAQAAKGDQTKEEYLTKVKANFEAKGREWDEEKFAAKFSKMDADENGILTVQERKDWSASRKKN